MCDVRSDFSEGSISSISDANRVRYLGSSCSFGVDLKVRTSDLARRFVFAAVIALVTTLLASHLFPSSIGIQGMEKVHVGVSLA